MKQYDAVVIGSGTGGLSAALTLAQAGKKILLIEQHNLPGGCSTSFVRGRFEFDATLHEFCGIGEEGNWGDTGKLLMDQYRLPVKWYTIPDMFRVVGKARSGKHYDVRMPVGVENCIRKMEETVPGSEQPMRTFFALAEECNQAANYFYEHMDQVDSKGNIKTSKLYFMKHFSNFLKVAERPYNEVLRKIGMPEDAIDILGTYWAYMALGGDKISFVQMAFMFYTYCKDKPAICEYNAHGLAVAGIERLREMGADIWLNVRGEQVVSDENGNIQGVQTSAGFVPTHYVIANMNPQTAYTSLLDPNIKVPEREIKKANASIHSSRFLNVYLGLNKSIEELGIQDYAIFFPREINSPLNFKESCRFEGNYFGAAVIYNVARPDISPKGTTFMVLTIEYNAEVWDKFSQREYVSKKQEAFKGILDAFEQETGIIIHDCIEEIEIATPWTFAHYLNTPQGSVYGYQYTDWDTMLSRLMMMRKDQPIKGFKTCGASGARGDGYSQTYFNGNDMANLILEEMEGR